MLAILLVVMQLREYTLFDGLGGYTLPGILRLSGGSLTSAVLLQLGCELVRPPGLERFSWQ